MEVLRRFFFGKRSTQSVPAGSVSVEIQSSEDIWATVARIEADRHSSHQKYWEAIPKTQEKTIIEDQLAEEERLGIRLVSDFEKILRHHAITKHGITFEPSEPVAQQMSSGVYTPDGGFVTHYPRTAKNYPTALEIVLTKGDEAKVLEIAGPTAAYALFEYRELPSGVMTVSNLGPEHFALGFSHPLQIAAEEGYQTQIIDATNMEKVEAGSIDCLMVSAMNTNPDTYAEMSKLLIETDRVLRPGGLLVLQGIDPWAEARDLEWAIFGSEEHEIKGGYIPIAYTTYDWRGKQVIYAANLVKPIS